MVVVAQLVRALDCGSRGRRFETGLPPHKKAFRFERLFLFDEFRTKSQNQSFRLKYLGLLLQEDQELAL